MNSPAGSLAVVAPSVPQNIVAIVDHALAFNMSDRWRDAATFQGAVRTAMLALGAPALGELPSSRAASVPAELVQPTVSESATLSLAQSVEVDVSLGEIAEPRTVREGLGSASAEDCARRASEFSVVLIDEILSRIDLLPAEESSEERKDKS